MMPARVTQGGFPGRIMILLLLLAWPATPAGAGGMSETVLPNGLRVVLRQVEGNPVICSAVLVRAGVAWEPPDMSGASHFLEHLLFNGTGNRTQEELYADVDAIGAYNNATTRADHTLFLLLAPSRYLQRALEIQADMLLHSTLPADKFVKEKGIVLAEMARDAGDPANLADIFFTRHLFAGSPYARPVLGTVESIQGLTREAVGTYYRERYQPRRMVLFLAGEFDPAEALELIRRQFPAPGAPAIEPDTNLPTATLRFASPAQAAHQHLEAGRTYLHVAFPAPPAGDPDGAAFDLLARALGGRSTALHEALQGAPQPLAYDYSVAYDTTGGAGRLTLSASLTGVLPAAEVVKRAAAALEESIDSGPLDQADLQMLHEEQLTADATLAEQVHYYAMFRAPRLLTASSAEVAREEASRPEVDVARLASLARRYLAPLRAIITVSGPAESDDTSSLMELSDVAERVPGDRPAATTGAATPEIHVLKNGLTLSIRTTPTDGVFAMHLLARNRSALEPPDRAGLADLVHRVLLRGTLAADAGTLDEELRSLGITTKFSDDARFPFDDYRTSPLFSFAVVETRREHGLAAMRLFAEILQTPRFDMLEVNRTVQIMQDLSRRQSESGRARSEQMFLELVAHDHALARPVSGTPTSLAGVSRREIMAMYQRLMAPNNLILSIRGGGPAGSLLRRARDLFGGDGPAGGFTPVARPQDDAAEPTTLLAPPSGPAEPRRREETLGKSQSYMRLGAILQVPAHDRPALAVAALVFSDRLQRELRERQGLAYSVGADLSPLGGTHHLLLISMGTAAENLEDGERETKRLALELAAQPVEKAELQRVVAARTGRILMRRLTSQNRAMYDGLQILFGAPTSGNREFLDALGAVSPGEVAAAARHYIRPEQWSLAVVR